MRGEATCSLSCIQITVVLFVGSLVYRLWKGGWWVNGATSIILGLLFGWEGAKMIKWALDPQFSGGCCGDCKPAALDAGKAELGKQRNTDGCCPEKDDCKQPHSCNSPPGRLLNGDEDDVSFPLIWKSHPLADCMNMSFLPFRLAVYPSRGIVVNLALALVLGLRKALIPSFVLDRLWTTVVH